MRPSDRRARRWGQASANTRHSPWTTEWQDSHQAGRSEAASIEGQPVSEYMAAMLSTPGNQPVTS
eukprot:47432-Eustigmatos_ZCMA.PRE.1